MIQHEGSKDITAFLLPILSAEAAHVTGDVQRYEAFLRDRMLVEEALTAAHREEPHNNWSYAEGDYRSPSKEEPAEIAWRIDAPPSGLEALWAQRLDDLLAQRQGLGKPVIVADFGAGFGISLIRIGAQEKYKQAIERGDLILVATNLGYLPPQETDEDGYTAVAKSLNARNKQDIDAVHVSADELDFLQAHQHNVQFLETDVLGFEHAIVHTADGGVLPLKGNIDILSEQMALAHSHIPDVALGVFAESLAHGGTFYLATKRATTMQPPYADEIEVAGGRTIPVDGAEGREYYAQRHRALEVGIAAATNQLGLELVQDAILQPMILSKP